MLRVDMLKVPVLAPVSFEVGEGEILALRGPSGSGKSLLLRAIADLDPADGRVFLNGAERGEMPANDWRKQVRYVASEPGWWGATAEDHFQPSRVLNAQLSRLALNPEVLAQPIEQLSTGERQRLAFLRATADNPAVLLLDEPTSALDEESTALVEELIRFQALNGTHVLLVSHNEAQAARLAKRSLAIGNGTAIMSSPVNRSGTPKVPPSPTAASS